MIKKLMGCIRENKKHTILTPLFMLGEVVFELLIPMLMSACILDSGLFWGLRSPAGCASWQRFPSQ